MMYRGPPVVRNCPRMKKDSPVFRKPCHLTTIPCTPHLRKYTLACPEAGVIGCATYSLRRLDVLIRVYVLGLRDLGIVRLGGLQVFFWGRGWGRSCIGFWLMVAWSSDTVRPERIRAGLDWIVHNISQRSGFSLGVLEDKKGFWSSIITSKSGGVGGRSLCFGYTI